jgi:stress response protein SCP2
MVALVKGQNAPLTAERIRITVQVAAPADLSGLLLTATGKVRSDADFAFYNQPSAPGVVWRQAGFEQQLDLDLTALPPNVERVIAVVSLDDRAFGAIAAPTARLSDPNGGELGSFEISGLAHERAVIAWEVYRRAGTWKFRAVGQGYSGGLAELVSVYGVAVEDAPSPADPPGAHLAHLGAPGDHPGDDHPAPVGAGRRRRAGRTGPHAVRHQRRRAHVRRTLEDLRRRRAGDGRAALRDRLCRPAPRQ